jgi:Toxin SymE, type I toxin-antitoxin system
MSRASAKDRRLKVSAAYRRRPFGASHFVSEVNLSGAWLAAAGFAPGDAVVVVVRDGELQITKAA